MFHLASFLSASLLLSAPQGAPPSGLSYAEITGAISTLKLDGGPLEIEAGDVNQDGCPDLVSVGDHGSPFVNTQEHGVTVWLGDCQGGWTLVQTGNFGYGGCALGDANGDGKMDIAYGVHHDYSSTDFGDQLLEVALGDGTGAAWTPWDDGLATNGETYGMFGTDLGDVDGDGDLDVGSNSFGCCAGVHVYQNLGNGSWSQSFGFLGGNADSSSFEFADFDGDGDLDIAAGSAMGTVWLGDGAGGFSLADGNLPGSHYVAASAGDADANGRDELAFVSGGLARVFAWGAGNQWQELTGNLGSISIPSVKRLSFADMDVDGRAELLAFGNGMAGIYSLGAAGSWSELWSGTTAGNGTKPGVFLRGGTDLDHNGLPDLWLVQSETTGTFSSRNVHRVLAETSVPAELAIRALAPEPGRVWRGGQARFVEWTSAVPAGSDLGKVTILFSQSGGAPPFTVLATGLANSGRAQVIVPSGVNSANCRLIYVVSTTALGRRRFTGPAFTTVP
jgi:hypothetical protein